MAPVGHHHPVMTKQRIKELPCPSCLRQFALTEWQQDFIARSADKGMTMVCLECQLCRMYFEFNPCGKTVGTSLVSRPREKKAEPALTLKQRRAVLKAWVKLGIEIPKSYAAVLTKMPKGTTLRLKGRNWQLHTVEELNRKTQIDRRRVLQIRGLQTWAKTLREAFGGADETQDESGRGYAFARLAAGISIGSENEDILFMDPSDGYSLWCLYPSEGGDVERLAKGIDAVVARIEKKLVQTR
jgi:hypothetical protein